MNVKHDVKFRSAVVQSRDGAGAKTSFCARVEEKWTRRIVKRREMVVEEWLFMFILGGEMVVIGSFFEGKKKWGS
jgi:hypothetical protein